MLRSSSIGTPLPAHAGSGSPAMSKSACRRSTICCWRDRRSRLEKECWRSAAAPAPRRCPWPKRSATPARSSGSTSPSRCWPARASGSRRAGCATSRCCEADAQVHAFEPDRFDLIASRFGVMFFADPVAAFRNLLRAFRPGGRLLCVLGGLEENRHWLIPYEVALRHLGPPAPKPPARTGPAGFQRPGIPALGPRRRGVRGIEIRRETPEIDRRKPAGGSRARLHHGSLGPADRGEEATGKRP